MKVIFFLLIGILATSPLVLQQVFATHYTAYNMDDAFYWREFDVDNVDSVWCTMNNIMDIPFDDTQISLECKHGAYSGSNRYGALLLMKVFNKADIQNGALTNVFTWSFDNTCTEATCNNIGMSVMEGAYNYSSLTEPGGFPNNIDYLITNGIGCAADLSDWKAIAGAGNIYLCLANSPSGTDKDNIFGAGDLVVTGSTAPDMNGGVIARDGTKGTRTLTRSVTQALWTESTESQLTVFLYMIPSTTATTNHFIQPRYFSITNTDYGTLTWNFPETTGEAIDWTNHDGAGEYQLNATSADYGYFWSFDPSVPDVPIDLNVVGDTGDGDNDLSWTTPEFDGYSDITGYKIERESPIGGGFSTLVANTGTNATTYPDNTIVVGTEYNYRVRALNTYGESAPSNESRNGSGASPDTSDPTPNYDCPSTTSSFELFVKEVTWHSVGLCWDSYSNSTNISGYQINFTTPFGTPNTIVINNTGTAGTHTYRPAGLSPSTDYSFRVKAWENATSNDTNIVNATTLGSEFNIGEFTVNAGTNPDKIDFKITKTIVNSTQTRLDVDFTNTLNPSCNFEYKIANTNTTYSNLTSSILDTNRNRTSFVFNDVQNDIIKVRCYDGDHEAIAMIEQQSYPLLEQLNAFRDGTYGTAGQFGAFDLITLCAIILSMIGFNRVAGHVGVLFVVIILGALATFGFIRWETVVISIPALVLFLVLAIISHSREDVSD